MQNIQVPVKRFIDGMHKEQVKVFSDFDNSIHRFFMLNWHRRARKTTLAINLLIREAVKHPNSRYGYVTSTYTACRNIVWRDPNMLKSYLPEEIVVKKNETELYVEFRNGSILSIHGSDNPDSLRGVDFKGVVIDEWAFVDPATWEQILRPIVAQDASRWAVFIFTPSGRNHAFRMWTATRDNPEWGHYTLSAETSGLIPAEELVKLRQELPQNTYAQEFGCEFGDDGAGVFHGVDYCVSGGYEGRKQGMSYVTGVDLARIEDYTVLTTLCRESRRIVSHRRFNNVDWSVQKEAIIDEVNKYDSMAVVDATGLGDPIFEDLSKAGVNARPYKLTNTSKKELIDRLAVAIEQRLISFPAILPLIDELKTYRYELTDARNIRYGAPHGMHDDCFVAGTMILTDNGQVPIEKIKVGNMVMTRNGYRPVIKIRNKYKKVIANIGLIGTPNHPVITTCGIKSLENVKDIDKLHVWNEKLSIIEEKSIIDIQNQSGDNYEYISGDMINGNRRHSHCIVKYGLTILEQFQKDMLFIIKTIIHLIIPSRTLSVCHLVNMPHFIFQLQKENYNQASTGKNKSKICWQVEENGERKNHQKSFCERMRMEVFTIKNQKKQYAYFVKQNLHIPLKLAVDFAESLVMGVITGRKKVYNLQVAETEEYFANNILVHNCVISLALAVWGCRNFLYGKAIDPDKHKVNRVARYLQTGNAGFKF